MERLQATPTSHKAHPRRFILLAILSYLFAITGSLTTLSRIYYVAIEQTNKPST